MYMYMCIYIYMYIHIYMLEENREGLAPCDARPLREREATGAFSETVYPNDDDADLIH